jgi:hypothetical protein
MTSIPIRASIADEYGHFEVKFGEKCGVLVKLVGPWVEGFNKSSDTIEGAATKQETRWARCPVFSERIASSKEGWREVKLAARC